jgi:Tol biopolymer transport system component
MHPPSKIQLMDITKVRGVESIVDLPGMELHNWAWSRDGRKLAISSWDAKDLTRNWVVDVQTRELKEIKLPRVKMTDGEVQMSVEDWSPDGQSFVAVGAGVHVVRTDGSKAKRLTPDKFKVQSGTCRFSPDGRKILFAATEGGNREILYVVDMGGGEPKTLVQFLNFSDLQACWSPDGRRIAYSVTFLDAMGKRGTESNLNVMDADGQNSTTIASATLGSQEMKLLLIGWR